MKKIIRVTESDLTGIVKRAINEMYSEKDMGRGEEIGKSSFGVDVKFPKDFRREKLIIKKLVRLKSKIDDERIKSEIDNILDMLEGTDDMSGAF
jgi:hypothetical protein